MNDIETNIYGWKLRLMEIESMISKLTKMKSEYEGYIKFWEDKLKENPTK